MIRPLDPRQFSRLGTILAGCLTVLLSGWAAAAPQATEQAPLLRIICVSSLLENEEVVVASRDATGAWREFGSLRLTSSLISGWLPAASGELHLAVRTSEGLVSKCRFDYPENTRRALAILLPDPLKKNYRADVVNPAKAGFSKGSTLLVNYSPLSGAVMLGSKRAVVESGKRLVVSPAPEANGMFRMLVGYYNQAKELVTCYDRYIPHNVESRDLLLLFPDSAVGLRVFSLAEFGPFE